MSGMGVQVTAVKFVAQNELLLTASADKVRLRGWEGGKVGRWEGGKVGRWEGGKVGR